MRIVKLLAAISGCLAGTAWALEPKSIDIQGLDFTPTLSLSERYDDNFRALSSDEQASWITTLTPEFTLTAEDRNSAYRLNYKAANNHYHSAADADHTDHELLLESIWAFSARQRLQLEAGYSENENTASTAINGENDSYSNSTVGGLYSFGAVSAANQLGLGLTQERLRYDNSGAINDDKDRDSRALVATWSHALGGSTRALMELRHTDYDYVLASSQRSSTNQALLAGATWEASARTTGKLRVGYERKDFDDDRVSDLSSPMWEVSVDWAPRSYSVVTLTARRAFDEGDDGADAMKTTQTELLWRHEWTSRTSTNVSLGRTQQLYEGQERDDDIDTFGLSLVYAVRRWLDISAGYRYRDNVSSLASESYQRNIYLLTLTGSF